MQFVKAGRYGEAIRFLEAVIAQYRLDPVEEFCAGQIAVGEVLGLYDSYDAQLGICAQVLYVHRASCCAGLFGMLSQHVNSEADMMLSTSMARPANGLLLDTCTARLPLSCAPHHSSLLACRRQRTAMLSGRWAQASTGWRSSHARATTTATWCDACMSWQDRPVALCLTCADATCARLGTSAGVWFTAGGLMLH